METVCRKTPQDGKRLDHGIFYGSHPPLLFTPKHFLERLTMLSDVFWMYPSEGSNLPSVVK
jgi:hypothetical protein